MRQWMLQNVLYARVLADQSSNRKMSMTSGISIVLQVTSVSGNNGFKLIRKAPN
jgi:hypothetical protein